MERFTPIFLIVGLSFLISFAGIAEEEQSDETESTTVLIELWGGKTVEVNAEEIAKHPLGSAGNPIRCTMPAGERAYLNRLRCENGRKPRYERSGSVGLGPYGKVMDLYDVECFRRISSPKKFEIYMDMYHVDYHELEPVEGFTIVPPKE